MNIEKIVRYKVTTELKTPIWKKLLRWMRLYSKMETFELQLSAWADSFEKGHVLVTIGGKIKIIKKI